MRLVVTADLHYDVARSRGPAESLADQINETEADAVLLVGDAATADGEALESCLRLFRNGRPRLFVPGNHELWTRRTPRPADQLLGEELPRRVEAMGWHWLPGAPRQIGNIAVVGNLGWYDYSFAERRLGLPQRFYEQKLSPRAAEMLGQDDLYPQADDVPDHARRFSARWNDGRFISGIESDAQFLDRELVRLRHDLARAADAPRVLAAIHMSPLAELLPPVPATGAVPGGKQRLAFARAYMGSTAIGRELLRWDNLSHIVCGHTHVQRRQMVGGRSCVNIGSTYTEKHALVLEIDHRQPR